MPDYGTGCQIPLSPVPLPVKVEPSRADKFSITVKKSPFLLSAYEKVIRAAWILGVGLLCTGAQPLIPMQPAVHPFPRIDLPPPQLMTVEMAQHDPEKEVGSAGRLVRQLEQDYRVRRLFAVSS